MGMRASAEKRMTEEKIRCHSFLEKVRDVYRFFNHNFIGLSIDFSLTK